MDTRNLVSEKNENSEESRNSVRFPDSFTINYNIVTQKEYDEKARFISANVQQIDLELRAVKWKLFF